MQFGKGVGVSQWGDIPNWSYDSIRSLLQALKIVDPDTYYHCLRVGEAAWKLGQSMGLNAYQSTQCQFTGLLHDIGKIGIDHSILFKPTKLEAHEFEMIKHHPIMSEKILEPFKNEELFIPVIAAVRSHHERIDGLGYPDKKIGDEIPLFSRVISVVDTVDAMSQNRVYRRGLPADVIEKEIKRCIGSQFDFQIAKTYLESVSTWEEVGNEFENIRKAS